MTYEWDLGDGTKMRGLRARHCYKKPGNYSIQLNIIDKSSGALFYNELTYDFTVEEPKLLFIDCPDTMVTGKITLMNSKKSTIPGYSLKEAYWFFGDGKYSLGNAVNHKYKKEGAYLVQLGVDARNDSTGVYKKFCVQKTILVKDSLWLKQHYSSLTKTTWPPPKKGTTKYHKTQKDTVNYRVHLGSSKENIPPDSKIFDGLKDVKKYKDQDEYKYTSGNVKTVSEAIPYYKKAKENGFKDAVVISFLGDKLNAGQTAVMKGEITSKKIVAVDVDPSKIVYTNTILFDFNKSDYASFYNPVLDSICDLLNKNKNYHLAVFAISDTVGTNSYNYKLSKKRALVVENYLIKKGIKKNRFETFILGENVPMGYKRRNNVVTSNRRVELLMVKNKK